MDIEPRDLIETAAETGVTGERRTARLNVAVALMVAGLATFTGLCKVKDDNIVQAMQRAQANKIDHWAHYQASSLQQNLAEIAATQLEVDRPVVAAVQAAGYDVAIAKYRALALKQAAKKDELQKLAEQDQQTYDALNYRDDQFDLSDALIAIAIAMLAVTALTRLWLLFWASMVPSVLGVLMGWAGLAGLAIHPDALVRLLS